MDYHPDGGAWQAGNTTLRGLTPGAHRVEFREIRGWTPPPSQQMNITAGGTATITGTYRKQ